MAAYAIFDIDIWDLERYQDFMVKVKPAIEAAGGRYLARGGKHKVIEGSWEPKRLVLFEFPSVEKAEAFYHSELYQQYKAIRDECSSGNIVIVEGIGQDQ
ncbi:DUF1330 domain-containing protein [Seongchinamella sediminis]|uniref:DUF1330 domain-containing protein n=1 Tax=Seongchinamella sediminis TaxID=2283635 RepID=A0A3L7DYR0_9GAMM|nr:DUF1330 domain-containing protein [Seongchinamella sediminis]RLQ22394.1 DUF1330 domain-containing protein [Seongchinamella sediminis]